MKKRSFLRKTIYFPIFLFLLVFSGCFEIEIAIDPETPKVGQTVTITCDAPYSKLENIYAIVRINDEAKFLKQVSENYFEFVPKNSGLHLVKIIGSDSQNQWGYGQTSFQVVVGDPQIFIDKFSSLGEENGYVWGHVVGVSYQDHKVFEFSNIIFAIKFDCTNS